MHQPRTNSLRSLICRVDVSAFGPVMFALVALFLVPSMVEDSPRWIPVNYAKPWPPVPMQGAMREDAREVARHGRVCLGRDQVDLDRFPVAIREGVSHGAEPKLYRRADARARYGVVTPVLDSVRSAGVEKIAFLVDARKTLVVAGSMRVPAAPCGLETWPRLR